jgi:hypothetical protein
MGYKWNGWFMIQLFDDLTPLSSRTSPRAFSAGNERKKTIGGGAAPGCRVDGGKFEVESATAVISPWPNPCVARVRQRDILETYLDFDLREWVNEI